MCALPNRLFRGTYHPPMCAYLSPGSGPQVWLGLAALCPQAGCLGNAPLLGTSIRKCQTVSSGSDLVPSPPSPSPFSIPVTSAQVANSLVSMGTEEGCLSFSVPNICLYKQWCGASSFWAWVWAWGGSALFIQRGRFPCSSGVGQCGMAAALDSGSPGQAGAWRGAVPGGRGGCPAQRVWSTWALLCWPGCLRQAT